MSRRAPTPIVLLAFALACTGEDDRGARPTAPTTLALRAGPSARLGDLSRAARGAEILIDVDGDRALYGSRLTATAEDLSFVPMHISLAVRGARVDVDAAPVFDAALIPGTDGLLLLGVDRALRHVTPTSTTRVDVDVVPGLACAADGRRVAYAKGDMPELDVWEAELDTRRTRAVANADGPEHAPFYSPSGDRVAWVAYPTGRPQLFARRGDVVTTLARSLSRVPDGRRGPIWRSGFIALLGRGGVEVLAETTGEVLLDVDRAIDLSLDEGTPAVRLPDGSWRTIDDGGSR